MLIFKADYLLFYFERLFCPSIQSDFLISPQVLLFINSYLFINLFVSLSSYLSSFFFISTVASVCLSMLTYIRFFLCCTSLPIPFPKIFIFFIPFLSETVNQPGQSFTCLFIHLFIYLFLFDSSTYFLRCFFCFFCFKALCHLFNTQQTVLQA